MIGYIAAALIGISLGLIGGGGSILTMPVLVYLFGISPVIATSYSLFVVGATSAIGSLLHWRKENVSISTALYFGISSIVTVVLIRKFLVPQIPETLGHLGSLSITSSLVTMILFALLMLFASYSMIKGDTITRSGDVKRPNITLQLLLYGVGIGIVTGILGAGGGFLLIPTLVLMLKLPMKKAVGTSLLIITMNSLLGFLGDIGNTPVKWDILLAITAIASAGMLIGVTLSHKIDGHKLKKGFGWFVLFMGLFILFKELVLR